RLACADPGRAQTDSGGAWAAAPIAASAARIDDRGEVRRAAYHGWTVVLLLERSTWVPRPALLNPPWRRGFACRWLQCKRKEGVCGRRWGQVLGTGTGVFRVGEGASRK